MVTVFDWIWAFALVLIMLSPLMVSLISASIDGRRAQRRRRTYAHPMTELEFYALRRRRKHDTIRRLRAVAREHGQSTPVRRSGTRR